jgi:aspartate/methionine/tyrosine aminotransferase
MSSTIALSERASALLHYSIQAEDTPAEAMPLHIQSAVEAALDRGETHYTDRPGILPLREKVAALLKERFGIAVHAGNDIIIACGVTEARFVAIQQILRPGDTLAAPGSSERLFAVALLRRAELVDAISPNASLVHLRSSTPETTLRAQLAAVPTGVPVLFEIDEPSTHFHPANLPGFEDRTITIGALGPDSWRIGYLASPGGPSSALRDFKQALTICSTNLSQWAMLAAMEAA